MPRRRLDQQEYKPDVDLWSGDHVVLSADLSWNVRRTAGELLAARRFYIPLLPPLPPPPSAAAPPAAVPPALPPVTPAAVPRVAVPAAPAGEDVLLDSPVVT
jgi:hypothetical protein